MNADPAFADSVDQAEMGAHELVEDALFQAAQSGNVVAMIFYLKNRKPDEWRDRTEHQYSGKGTDGAILIEYALATPPTDALATDEPVGDADQT
jgi:hypothetical protein